MADPLETEVFAVEPGEAGQRLDVFLARRAAGQSRSRLKQLVLAGHVSVDGRAVTDASHRLAAGSDVALAVPAAAEPEPQGEAIPLAIVFEDADLVVIDKPAGLVVHPGAGNWSGTLVNALIAHCGASLSGVGGVRRPGIVHRLDKDTSGLIVVAKNDAAHRGLAAQFADHGRSGPLRRAYDALVWGVPHPHMGSIDAPLHRDSRNRQKQSVARAGGRHAVTHYRLIEQYRGVAALVECRLETGRTHQIRVHFGHVGHPLLGDRVYGAGFLSKADALPMELRGAVRAFPRQALHARLLGFAHPRSGAPLLFEAEWPEDLRGLVDSFRRWGGAGNAAPFAAAKTAR